MQVRETLFAAYRGFQRMVKDERFKLIEYAVHGRRTTQLFDLETDPLELHNLAADETHAGRLNALRETLFQWRDEWDDEQSEWGKAFWDGVEN